MDEKPKRGRGAKPLDRLIALNCGLLGIGAYLLALGARDKDRWALARCCAG